MKMQKRPGNISSSHQKEGGDCDDSSDSSYYCNDNNTTIANKRLKSPSATTSSSSTSSVSSSSSSSVHQMGLSSDTVKTTNYFGSGSGSADPLVDVLNNLSLEDREHGLHVLHGIVETTIEESPEMLQSKVQEMPDALSIAIETLPSTDTYAYRKAYKSNPQYVDNFKSSFVRSSDYEIHDAANRLIAFFHQKLMLFGEDCLVKDITQDDLDEQTLAATQMGITQILQRDRSGRPIIYLSGRVNGMYELEHVLRSFFYIVMALVGPDKETQLRGVVLVWDGLGVTTIKNRTKEMWALFASLPTRASGIHTFGEFSGSQYVKSIRLLVSKFMERRALCRLRFHEGSYIECIYAVMTFGIPKEAIPIAEDGSPDLTNHHKMLDILKSREERRKKNNKKDKNAQTSPAAGNSNKPQPSSDSSSFTTTSCNPKNDDFEEEEGSEDGSTTILIPGQMDVLLGRGRQPASRPGSLKMHHLVLENLEAYDTASDKFEKTRITESILKQMNDAGCRFLSELPTGGYVECDHDVARTKISLAFRNQRRNKKKKQGKQQQQQQQQQAKMQN